jgi:predicted lipoprotein with Yx(FWY)xxD motif
MRLAIPLVVIVASTVVAAATASPKRAPVLLRATSLGPVLVDARGRTLYLFAADHGAKSSCYAQCAAAWPPYLTSDRPVATKGLRQSLLKTATRKDGRLQVVYAGHPLYFFKGDGRAGATNGEGVGGTWYAVTARGAKVAAKAAPPPATTTPSPDPGYGGGYGGYDP